MSDRCDCGKPVEPGRSTCFRCRVASVSVKMKAPAVEGRFHHTKDDYMRENFGTTDDRELGKRGIERV